MKRAQRSPLPRNSPACVFLCRHWWKRSSKQSKSTIWERVHIVDGMEERIYSVNQLVAYVQ